MNREKVLDRLYAAHTLREIEAARRLHSSYLAQHPEDDEVRDLGEMFCMMAEAIKVVGED